MQPGAPFARYQYSRGFAQLDDRGGQVSISIPGLYHTLDDVATKLHDVHVVDDQRVSGLYESKGRTKFVECVKNGSLQVTCSLTLPNDARRVVATKDKSFFASEAEVLIPGAST